MTDTTTVANIMLAIIVGASLGSIFFVHESNFRKEAFMGYVSKAMVYAGPVLAAICANVFNDAYFHFSGFPGLVVAGALVCGIFCIIPMYVMDLVCKKYLHKECVAQAS